MKKYIFLILIISSLAFTFTGNHTGGWYQQFVPDVGGMPISDIEFLDSLTGFIVTGSSSNFDTNYVLKTTNGGDNWTVNFKRYNNFFKIKFINDSIGYICGSTFTVNGGALYKTTNRGNNWIEINTFIGNHFDDMSILNEDTIWVVDNNTFNGGVFRTTNGGVNWTNQYFNASGNPDKIYMINGRIGFMGALFKTTNSGLNWFQVDVQSMGNMYFKDTLTGWRANGSMKKTTNGGINWVNQTLPSGGPILTSVMADISVLNDDTIWGVGGQAFYGAGQWRGIIYRTTNGGINWYYQIPDTSIHLQGYLFIEFINSKTGWAFGANNGIQGGVHTVSGGDSLFTNINSNSNFIPKSFILYQNFPNPFNPTTKIRYDIHRNAEVGLSVYDMSGKEVMKLVNERQGAGSYEVDFPGIGNSSGVYFYVLKIDSRVVGTRKMVLVK